MSEQLPLWFSRPSTSSPEGSPAKTSAERATAKDSEQPNSPPPDPACGGNITASSPPSVPPSPSSKTSPRVKAVGCAPCGGACTNSATTRPLYRSPRATSEPPTSESGSSLWPTARARDHKGPGFGDDLPGAVAGKWPTPTARDATSGAGHGANMQGGPSLRTTVRAAVGVGQAEPTAARYGSGQNGSPHDHRESFAQKGKPSLDTLVRMTWPTPTAQDAKLSGVQGNWTPESGRNSGTTLTDAAIREGKRTCEGQSLNPAWVETLMGFPPGWTEIQTSLFDGPRDSDNPSTHGNRPDRPLESLTETSA